MAISPGGRPISYAPLGPKDLWKTPGLKLPDYIRGVAHGINPADPEAAIPIAVSRMKVWAAGGQHVHPAVRAAAVKALAEWEAARGAAHANLSTPQPEAIDLAMTKGAMPPLKGSTKPRFPINNHTDVKNAVKMVGLAKGNKAVIRRHVISRAKALGAAHLIPFAWTSNGQCKP